jgi:hypothetical protein
MLNIAANDEKTVSFAERNSVLTPAGESGSSPMRTRDGSDSDSDSGSDSDDEGADRTDRTDRSDRHAGSGRDARDARDALAHMTPTQLAEYEHRTEQLKAQTAQEQTVQRASLIRKFRRLKRRGHGDVPDLGVEALQVMELTKLELMVQDLTFSEEAEYWVDNIKRFVITLAFFLELAVEYLSIDGLSLTNYQRTLFLTIDKLEEPMYELFEKYMFTATRGMNPVWKLFVSLSLNLFTFVIHKNFSKSYTQQVEDNEKAKKEAAVADMSPPRNARASVRVDSDDEDEPASQWGPVSLPSASFAPPSAPPPPLQFVPPEALAAPAVPSAEEPVFVTSVAEAKQLDAQNADTAPSSPLRTPVKPPPRVLPSLPQRSSLYDHLSKINGQM